MFKYKFNKESKMKNQNSETNIIATILDCGYADVGFLLKALEAWQVDFEDAWEYVAAYDKRECSALIYATYNVAFETAIADFNSDAKYADEESELLILSEEVKEKLRDGFDSFINSIDSHFYLKDANGDHHELYNYNELQDFIAQFITDYRGNENGN